MRACAGVRSDFTLLQEAGEVVARLLGAVAVVYSGSGRADRDEEAIVAFAHNAEQGLSARCGAGQVA